MREGGLGQDAVGQAVRELRERVRGARSHEQQVGPGQVEVDVLGGRATGQGPALNRRIELTALRRDGTEFPVELAITAMRLGDATVFSAFLRDITDRKRTEKALRDSEGSFRLLFTANPLTIPAGTFTFIPQF